jgi:hypothetical protein
MTDLDQAISQIEIILSKLNRVHGDLTSERLRRVHASSQNNLASYQSSEAEIRASIGVLTVRAPHRLSEESITGAAAKSDRGYGHPTCLGDII